MPETITITQLARVIHEANRAYQSALGQPVDPDWDTCGQSENDIWRQESTINSVKDLLAGNVDFEEQHNRWLQERFAGGWVIGPVKDPVAKTSPALVPWDQVPDTEKAKNVLRLGIFNALRHVLCTESADPRANAIALTQLAE